MDKTLNDPLDPMSHDGLAAPITNWGTYDHPDPSNMNLRMIDSSKGTFLVNLERVVVGFVKLVRRR